MGLGVSDELPGCVSPGASIMLLRAPASDSPASRVQSSSWAVCPAQHRLESGHDAHDQTYLGSGMGLLNDSAPAEACPP